MWLHTRLPGFAVCPKGLGLPGTQASLHPPQHAHHNGQQVTKLRKTSLRAGEQSFEGFCKKESNRNQLA